MRLQKNHFPVCSSSTEIGTQPEESAPSGMFTAPASPDPRSRDPAPRDPAPSHTVLPPAQTPAHRDPQTLSRTLPHHAHRSGQPRPELPGTLSHQAHTTLASLDPCSETPRLLLPGTQLPGTLSHHAQYTTGQPGSLLPGTAGPRAPVPLPVLGQVAGMEPWGCSPCFALCVNYFFALSRNTSQLLESRARKVAGWKVPAFTP